MHGRQTLFHHLVGEVQVDPLHDRRVGVNAGKTHIPAVDGHQREQRIRQKQYEAYGSQRVTDLPGDTVDAVEQRGQDQPHPHHAKHTPEEHELAAGAAADRQPFAGVVPRLHADRDLHEPAADPFERAAQHGRRQEDRDDARPVHAVQADGHQNHAETVDRGELAVQEAGTVLIPAEHDGVIHRFDRASENAADREQPEHVEEVQLHIPFAGAVAAKHAVLFVFEKSVSLIHAPQRALQTAFLAKPRIDRNGQCRQQQEPHDGDQQIPADAMQAQREHDLDERQRHEHVSPGSGTVTVLA